MMPLGALCFRLETLAGCLSENFSLQLFHILQNHCDLNHVDKYYAARQNSYGE
jgi:hypothetical protein